MLVPQRKNIVFPGTATRQVGELDKKAKEGEDTMGAKSRVNWKGREEGGFGSLLEDRYRRHDGTEKDQYQNWKKRRYH